MLQKWFLCLRIQVEEQKKKKIQSIVFEFAKFYNLAKIWELEAQGTMFIGNIYMLKLPKAAFELANSKLLIV